MIYLCLGPAAPEFEVPCLVDRHAPRSLIYLCPFRFSGIAGVKLDEFARQAPFTPSHFTKKGPQSEGTMGGCLVFDRDPDSVRRVTFLVERRKSLAKASRSRE